MTQEELRKKMHKKEKVLEMVTGEGDSEVARLRECLGTLEERVCTYYAERNTLKSENAELTDARSALAKENEARREKLRVQSDQIRELIQQVDDLKLTNDVLQKEVINISDLREKLVASYQKRPDLRITLVIRFVIYIFHEQQARTVEEKNCKINFI